MMFSFSWVLCMLWGSFAIFKGEMTYGSLAAMIQLIGRVQGPIASAVSIATEAYGVIASAERLMELTELPSEVTGEPLTDFDEIIIEQMFFRYDDGTEDVLKGINCTIHKGDFVALTGSSGGGKTSLFQLLLGIYQPTSGSIMYRNGNRKMPASRETRALFAYVPQGNTLFSGTLRENLTMFTDYATEKEIDDAITLYKTIVKHIHVTELDIRVNEEMGGGLQFSREGVAVSDSVKQHLADQYARVSLTVELGFTFTVKFPSVRAE